MAGMNFQVPSRAVAVTPSDTVDLPETYGFYVGTTGNVAVMTEGGDTVTFVGCPAGLVISLRIRRIMSTNTTATNIVRFGSGTDRGDQTIITQVNGDSIITATSGAFVVLPN